MAFTPSPTPSSENPKMFVPLGKLIVDTNAEFGTPDGAPNDQLRTFHWSDLLPDCSQSLILCLTHVPVLSITLLADWFARNNYYCSFSGSSNY